MRLATPMQVRCGSRCGAWHVLAGGGRMVLAALRARGDMAETRSYATVGLTTDIDASLVWLCSTLHGV